VEVCPKVDFIILESNIPVCKFTPKMRLPARADQYVMIGISNFHLDFLHKDSLNDELLGTSVSLGLISSDLVDDRGHVYGSVSGNPGDSGGGIFSLQDPKVVMGISVRNDAILIDGNLRLDFLMQNFGTKFPSRSHIIPVSSFL